MIWLLKLLPVLIGIICIIIAWIPEHDKSIKTPVVTQAEVIDCVTQKMFRKQGEIISYAPVVRYQTEQGEFTATARVFVPEWQYRYRTGEKITICYEKTNPYIFGIRNGSRFEVRKLLCMTAGIGILTAYAVLWIQYH